MEMLDGVLIKLIAGFYYVEAGDVVYECKARGLFRKQGIAPVVGDRVEIEVITENTGVLTKVFPRKNSLIRPPLANIDRLFIISSYSTPSPSHLVIDKLTAIAEHNDIEPVIVFNKCDMGSFDDWADIYTKAGFKVFITSCKTGEGLDELKAYLTGAVSAFTGNSGVGKSSMLNCLIPELKLKTAEVSQKLGRGRHTTRHVVLYRLPGGGYVADTPGFSAIDLEKSEIIFKDKLPYCFRDFERFLGQCRFTTCSHTKEVGCAIREAVNAGEICRTRYESYLAIYETVKDIKEWEIPNKL